MIVTLPYLHERFTAFNAQYFDGALPEPILRVSTARRMLGHVRYRRERCLFGGTHQRDLTLSISRCYDLPEDELDDTILHEMIHLYIITHNIKDSSTHGRVFRRLMQTLNTRYGRHITISHRGPLSVVAGRRRQMIIAVVVLNDGRTCVLRPVSTRLFALARDLSRLTEVRQVAWYNSSDPFFASFPRSMRLKLYRADGAVVAEKLRDAIPLQIVGGRVRRLNL